MRRVGADKLQANADHMRQAGRYLDAGVLYAASCDFVPNPRLHVQAGHMFKEAGDFSVAEDHYLAALAALPGDADLALQLGHFYKTAGQVREAITWYRRAGALRANWIEPERELNQLGLAGDHDQGSPPVTGIGRFPLRHSQAFSERPDAVVLRHFGSEPDWNEPRAVSALRGVESVRGVCVSATPLHRAELWLDGKLLAQAPCLVADDLSAVSKYVFNIWHNFADISRGVHQFEIRVIGDDGKTRRARRDGYVGDALNEARYPDSDAVVDPPLEAGLALDDWLRQRPSMARPARGRFFTRPLGCIVVIRPDQLGDMVVSLPALRRLRELVPQARIVGLVSQANADLARSLAIFDEIEPMSWDPSAPAGERRITEAEQQRLAAMLRSYRPDVAIDLLVSGASRLLLTLSGAPCTVGFDDSAWPWLTVGVSGRSHDVKTGHEMAPHAARVLALVERFGTLLDSGDRIVGTSGGGGGEARLGEFEVRPGQYAVLHAGARHVLSRWPGYEPLAARLLCETDLDLVIFGEHGAMPPALVADGRVRVIDRELPFADFDALLAHAAVFVGNDSGPKHLASLRGTPVVSIHSARVDWREWGQTQTGIVVSRRLPCAGCSLHADQQNECGRNYACVTDIGTDEVFAAVNSLL